MKYLPFLDGKYSTAPGFECRKETIHKYYLEKDLYPDTLIEVNKLLAGQLVKEYPADFVLTEQKGHYTFHNKITGGTLQWKNDWIAIEHRSYISLFDALFSHLPASTSAVESMSTASLEYKGLTNKTDILRRRLY